MKQKFITLTKFAEQNGIVLNTVCTAIKSGRITSVQFSATWRAIGINPVEGLQQFHDNTDPGQSIKSIMKVKGESGIISPILDGTVIYYQVERAKREQFSAKTAELKYLKMAGELVSAEDVRREVNEIIYWLRNFLIYLKVTITPFAVDW